MNKTYLGYLIRAEHNQVEAKLENLSWDEIQNSEVIIEVHYSSVNFKDALAATGKGKILRRSPLVGGIDAAGIVVAAKAGGFQPGEKVLVTGCGLSETQHGGYAEFLGVPATSVVRLPNGLSLRESMILGTAGFTAGLCLIRLEQNGQTPQKGPILITGASGGVGSLSTQILASQGYEVWAVSGKAEAEKFLTEIGARKIFRPQELELGSRPLESVRFAGAIDNVGGDLLAGILRHVDLWGNVAAVGLASSAELHTNVMPFILRGVSLLGISSNNAPLALRQEIWRRLGGIWKPKNLEQNVNEEVTLKSLDSAFEKLLRREVMGRILVRVHNGASK